MGIFSNVISALVPYSPKNIINVVTALIPTKDKITNTLQTVKAAVTGQGVQANTPNPTVNKVLSTAASNPFTTAAVVTVGVAPKIAATIVTSGIKALPTSGKIALAVATPVVIGATIKDPNIVSKAAELPKNLSSFGSNIGTFSANPSIDNALQIAKDNPIISGGVIAATGIIAGKGVTGILNTIAVKENTAATNKILENMNTTQPISNILPSNNNNLPAILPTSTTGTQNKPITPETQIIPKSASSTSIKKYRKETKKIPQTQSLRVNIYNQSRMQSVKYLNVRNY
jgi:hypothetical protein